MAIRATGFKPHGPQGSRLALSCRGFLANLSDSPRKAPEANQRHQTRTIAMIDQQIEIATKDGHTTTFITHPERGGPFPGIIFYMDAPAIREEFRDIARRFGTSGYYVMLPHLYYPAGVIELGPLPADPEPP